MKFLKIFCTQASFENIRKWLDEISRYAGDHVPQNIIIATTLLIVFLIIAITILMVIINTQVTRLLVGNKADLAERRVVAPDLAQV